MSSFYNVKVAGELSCNTFFNLLPGEIVMFPVSSSSLDSDYFLECNGGSYNQEDYDLLFTAISTRFGSGDGSNTFNVPNLEVSSTDNAVHIRGDENMKSKSNKLNTSVDNEDNSYGNNKINEVVSHNEGHTHTISYNANVTADVELESFNCQFNNTGYGTGNLNSSSGDSKRGYHNNAHFVDSASHTHDVSLTSTNNTYTKFIESTTISSNEMTVLENTMNKGQQNYLLPSIKIKYYIFVGQSLSDSSNYDSTNETTSSFQKVTLNSNLSIPSNEVMTKPNKIIMYAGHTPPDGYIWCDGSNSTPDLKGYFISSASTNNVNTTPNEYNTIKEMPSHTHDVKFSNNNTSYTYESEFNINSNVTYDKVNAVNKTSSNGNGKHKGNHSKRASNNHTHGMNYFSVTNNYIDSEVTTNNVKFSIESNITTNESSQSVGLIPSYIPIGFIMKST